MALCVGACLCHWSIAAKAESGDQAITLPIFSQRISFHTPKEWRLLGETAGQSTYSASFLPVSESLSNWKSMITVHGFRKPEKERRIGTIFGEVVEQYQARCRTALVTDKWSSYKVGTQDVLVFAIECNEDLRGAQERGYFLVIQGKPSLYVLAYAEHGAQRGGNHELKPRQFLELIAPVRLCDAGAVGKCAELALAKP
jgi:hypothetical protein